ncbi:hypothetical protein S7711_07691 [Stachybotrys chartarum IBT 7711]|uniref:DUF7729 domain-containing protein n=1 Tax=Stachybotrys chartarum (strain CBS 109288 / IBT 7711) TaxID=1280523 RepID=A0A084AWH3_STACB|nr:hypothetical protein S7711_07691 [Stachybotrys chartarum IBT 7711]KFA80198.1 hypothetical protein S40288_07309 [Stachybotrys chartarum IBT 40288]
MSKCTPSRIRTALSVLAVAACLMPAVAALPHGPALPQITSISHLDEAISVPAAEIQIPITSYLGRIVVDSKEPELRRRQDDEDEDESSTSTSEEDDERTTSRENGQRSTRSEDDGESEPTRSRSPTSVVTISAPETTPTISPTPSPLPQPFDDSIPSDFRLEGEDNSCPSFMTNLLADPTFQECYPLSMMLMSSTAFFRAQQNLFSIVRVLDETCRADVAYCANYLGEVARNLTAEENCRAEYQANHSLTMLAYNGTRTYEMLYAATCLQDPDTDMYCYASAVTNATNPSDGRFYFMPFGPGLPGASTPSCSWCTQRTMAIFHSASADRSQAISATYVDAAHQVNTICGPNFVNTTLPSPESASSALAVPMHIMALFSMGVAVGMHVVL